MLPFLKNNKEASMSEDADPIKRKSDDGEDFDGLAMAAQDLCDAIHAKDTKAVAQALKAAFQICDMEPHEEGEHV